MEIENAITWIKAVRFSSGHLIGLTGKQALGLALDSLEKQIPKAPIDDPEAWLCPNCRCHISHEQQLMYCRQCGQLVDWSNV